MNTIILHEILGDIKILSSGYEKAIKTCFYCHEKRQFLAILKPCDHELCTTCTDLHYDACLTGYFACPKCSKQVSEIIFL